MLIKKRFKKIMILTLVFLLASSALVGVPAYAVTQEPISLSKTATNVDGSPRYYDIELKVTGNPQDNPVDVVLMIDRSTTMEDNIIHQPFPKTKAAAKQFADTLLTNIPGSRIAVVSYAGASPDNTLFGIPYWNAPPTFDRSTTPHIGLTGDKVTVASAIDSIAITEKGTDLKSAFQKAAQIISDSDQKERPKIIVLMCNSFADMGAWKKVKVLGTNYYIPDAIWLHATEAVNAAKSAKDSGIKVYTLGLWSHGNILDVITMTNAATDPTYYYEASMSSDNIDDRYQEIAARIASELAPKAIGTNAVVTDIISEEFELVTNPLNPSQGSANFVVNTNGTTTITWTIGEIIDGDATLTYRIKAKDSTTTGVDVATNDSAVLNYENSAGQDGGPLVFPVPTVDVPPIPAYGITIDKTGPDAAKAGETITYWFTVTNTGNQNLYNIVVTDPMFADPGNLDGTIEEIPFLAPSEEYEFSESYTIPADYVGQTLENTATVTADTEGGEF